MDNPWQAYIYLKESKADAAKSRQVLCALLAGVSKKAKKLKRQELSAYIQRTCGFQEKVADSLARMFRDLLAPGEDR